MSNWWVPAAQQVGLSPSSTTTGGGGSLPSNTAAVQYRDPLDAKRAAAGQLPQAQYPDGYLGNIIDRRQDRLLQGVQNRLTANSYQRGVHKGSLVDPGDYFWPDGEVSMDSGLQRQSEGRMEGNVILTPRYSPQGSPMKLLAHMGKSPMVAPEDQDHSDVVVQDPGQTVHFEGMLPKYRSR